MDRTLAPKRIEGILRETFTIYKNNFLRLMAIVAIVQVPVIVLALIASLLIPTYGHWLTEDPSPFILFLWVTIYFTMFAASIWMVGAVIHAVSEQYFNRTVSIDQAYSFAWRRLGDMFWAAVLVCLALVGIYLATILISISIALSAGRTVDNMLIGFIMAGMLSLFMTPAIIYLSVNWTFTSPTALFEGYGPKAALSHSWALVKGSWWRVLGMVMLLLLIVQAVFMIFYMPAMMGALGGVMSGIMSEVPGGFTPYAGTAFPSWMIWALIGGTIGNIISLPLFVIGTTLLYFDLRVRKQGYSLNALADELGLRRTSVDSVA